MVKLLSKSLILTVIILILGTLILILFQMKNYHKVPVINKKNIRVATTNNLNRTYRLINLTHFKFITNPNSCNNCKYGFLVLFTINSSIQNIEKRNAIRKTWGQRKDCIQFLFSLGVSSNEEENVLIQEESQKHGDIIQGNFLDSYRNLTYKHAMNLQWTTEYCKKAKFLVKTDDDIIVNVRVLYEKLKNHFLKSDGLIACEVTYHPPVLRNRDSKWFVSKEEYSEDYYPDHCQGQFVIYSPDVLDRLLKELSKTPYFWIDDVHITGVLAKKIDLKLENINQWYSRSSDDLLKNLDARVYGPGFLAPKDINDIWKAIEEKNPD